MLVSPSRRVVGRRGPCRSHGSPARCPGATSPVPVARVATAVPILAGGEDANRTRPRTLRKSVAPLEHASPWVMRVVLVARRGADPRTSPMSKGRSAAELAGRDRCWWRRQVPTLWPLPFHGSALPAELRRLDGRPPDIASAPRRSKRMAVRAEQPKIVDAVVVRHTVDVVEFERYGLPHPLGSSAPSAATLHHSLGQEACGKVTCAVRRVLDENLAQAPLPRVPSSRIPNPCLPRPVGCIEAESSDVTSDRSMIARRPRRKTQGQRGNRPCASWSLLRPPAARLTRLAYLTVGQFAGQPVAADCGRPFARDLVVARSPACSGPRQRGRPMRRSPWLLCLAQPTCPPLGSLDRTLCQLSYTAVPREVGPRRLERPTSSLSGMRSNRLSYRPVKVLAVYGFRCRGRRS